MKEKIKIALGVLGLAVAISAAAVAYDALKDHVDRGITLAEDPRDLLPEMAEGTADIEAGLATDGVASAAPSPAASAAAPTAAAATTSDVPAATSPLHTAIPTASPVTAAMSKASAAPGMASATSDPSTQPSAAQRAAEPATTAVPTAAAAAATTPPASTAAPTAAATTPPASTPPASTAAPTAAAKAGAAAVPSATATAASTVPETAPTASTAAPAPTTAAAATADAAAATATADAESESEAEAARVAAPDFTVEDADGNAVKLSDMLGKPVVLNFWASWCPPCKAEMPEFDKVWAEMGDDVTFMMVDLTDGQRETKEIGAAYAAEQGFSFPIYYDVDQEAAYAYGVRSIPTTLLIDKEGYVITGAEGQIDEETLRYGISLIAG